MMNRQHIATLAMAAMAAASCATGTPEWMTCAGIARAMESANDHWQSTHPDSGNAFWDNAVYHTGNIEACLVRPDTAWLGYSTRWAERNRWMGATCPDTALWQYRPYGEGPEFVLFGDWQVCFQTYLDLALMQPDSIRTARAFYPSPIHQSIPCKTKSTVCGGEGGVIRAKRKVHSRASVEGAEG